jgi:Tol biopolymer transport system component
VVADGTRILFSSERAIPDADLYSVPGEGGGIDAVTLDDDVDQIEPAWSPDGLRLAYVERQPTDAAPRQQTVGMVIDGQHVGREGDLSPAWSPDGSRLAFVNGDAVWIERDDGTHRRRIARGLQPAWSPDGRSIAYATQVGALAVADVASGRSRVIVSTGRLKEFLGAAEAGVARSPTWAPDGRTIGFIGVGANFHADAVVSAVLTTPDGRGLSVLTTGLGGSFGASLAWSPDGRVLASTADDHVVVVDPKTGAKTEVAPELAGWSADPTWRPVCGLTGTTRNDVLRGSPGADLVCGLEGNDRIIGGRGRDHLLGGAGNDTIVAADHTADVIGCGRGRDTVIADRQDVVGVDCERVRRLP